MFRSVKFYEVVIEQELDKINRTTYNSDWQTIATIMIFSNNKIEENYF